MSTLKTVTSAVTAVALVTGIGLAWAQTEDQSQPTNTTTAAGAMPSEQTPADPNAVPPVDNTAANSMQQQQPQADDPSRTTPPADSTATPLPSDNRAAPANSMDNGATTPDTTTSSTPSYEPAPRADRN